MSVKQAEADFATLCAHYNIWCHKWRDVMYCPNCHRPVFMTQRTDQRDTNAEAQQSIVDYLIFTGSTPHWVECKGKGGDTRFALSDLSQKQRNFLNSWDERLVMCWLFLTLGDGKAPAGRKAWLIPWGMFAFMEKKLFGAGVKSIPWKETGRIQDPVNATDSFRQWELEWGERGIGWTFTRTHSMITHAHVDELPPLYGAS